MANILGLLGAIGKAPWEGLKAYGRNFDRNAVGGLDELMGKDFTPGMRSMLRSNAISSLGNAIAGKETFGEGLSHGQNRLVGLWQVAQAMKDQRQEREAMKQIYGGGGAAAAPQEATGAEPGPVSAPGDPGDPGLSPRTTQAPAAPAIVPGSAEDLEQQAAKQMGFYTSFMRLPGKGSMARAKEHFTAAKELLAEAEKRRERPVGGLTTLLAADGTPVSGFLTSNFGFKPLPGGMGAGKDWVLVGTGDEEVLVNKADPKDRIALKKKPTPGEAQQAEQFAKTENRAERTLQEQIRSNVARQLNEKKQLNLGWAGNTLAAQRLELAQLERGDKQDERFNPAPYKLEEGAVTGANNLLEARKMMDNLLNVLDTKEAKAWMGTSGSLATAPYGVGSAFEALGITKPAQLQAYFETMQQKLGTALEKGVLHKDDVPKYQRIVLSIENKPYLAKGKINQLRGIVQHSFDSWEESQRKANRNTRGFWQDTTGGYQNDPYPNARPTVVGVEVRPRK